MKRNVAGLLFTLLLSTFSLAHAGDVSAKMQLLKQFEGIWFGKGLAVDPEGTVSFIGHQVCHIVEPMVALQCQGAYLGSDGLIIVESVQASYDELQGKFIWDAVYSVPMFNDRRICDFSADGKTLSCQGTEQVGNDIVEKLYSWTFATRHERSCIWQAKVNGFMVRDMNFVAKK